MVTHGDHVIFGMILAISQGGKYYCPYFPEVETKVQCPIYCHMVRSSKGKTQM